MGVQDPKHIICSRWGVRSSGVRYTLSCAQKECNGKAFCLIRFQVPPKAVVLWQRRWVTSCIDKFQVSKDRSSVDPCCTIDLSAYCLSGDPALYNLAGIIAHEGTSATNGHYVFWEKTNEGKCDFRCKFLYCPVSAFSRLRKFRFSIRLCVRRFRVVCFVSSLVLGLCAVVSFVLILPPSQKFAECRQIWRLLLLVFGKRSSCTR